MPTTIKRLPGSEPNGEYVGWHVDWIEEWTQWFGSTWYTFHFLLLEFDHEPDLGTWEVTAIVLGLGFTLTRNYRETELLSGLREQVEEIKREHGDEQDRRTP